MKKRLFLTRFGVIVLLLTGLFAFTYSPQVAITDGIKFMKWEEAAAKTQVIPKKIFVDIYTPWCGPCKIYGQRMEDPEIAKYINEKYYAVKFNGESADTVRMGDKVYTNPNYISGAFRNSTHQLTMALGVQAYPTTLIFDENLVLIQQFSGAQDKLVLDQILHYFGENKYQTQKWEDFLKEYHSPFETGGQ